MDGRGGCSVELSKNKKYLGLSTNRDALTAEQAASNFGDNRFRIVSL